ncbi:MAG: ribonuclease P protein component [Rhodanobacteraceae bacterium]
MSGTAGLPPQARLRSAADFGALRHAPGTFDTRYFLIRYGRGATAQARCGLAVSRKVSKRAVQRNRIKRIARESFRHVRAQLPPLDILLIARVQAVDAPNQALRGDLDRAWPRLQALKRAPGPGTIAD